MYTFPVVREILDPKTGRPAAVMGTSTVSQRDLVVASLLRVPPTRTDRASRPDGRV